MHWLKTILFILLGIAIVAGVVGVAIAFSAVAFVGGLIFSGVVAVIYVGITLRNYFDRSSRKRG
jgi:hypothetical protein